MQDTGQAQPVDSLGLHGSADTDDHFCSQIFHQSVRRRARATSQKMDYRPKYFHRNSRIHTDFCVGKPRLLPHALPLYDNFESALPFLVFQDNANKISRLHTMRSLQQRLPHAYRRERSGQEKRENSESAVHSVRAVRQRVQAQRAENKPQKGGIVQSPWQKKSGHCRPDFDMKKTDSNTPQTFRLLYRQ